ncbi:MAG: hypothetical protein RL685_114 [Pseudomonadota bacterium]
MTQRNVIPPLVALYRLTSATTLGLCATLLGCSDDSINMGEGIPVVQEPVIAPSGRCAESAVLAEDVIAHNQAEVDALEGCEVIDGSLTIMVFAGANLFALHALTEVRGALYIGEIDQEQPEQQGVLESGWLPSLEGLESLERAGSLHLSGLTSEDLAPLAELRTLTSASLSISSSNLRSFDGLQNLTGVRYLRINAALRLESFDGLTLPENMGQLDLTDVDLRRLKPLGVMSIDSIRVEDTGLHDLTAFADLRYTQYIQIVANQKMESLAGLEDIDRIESLDLDYNRYLLEIPDFNYLFGLTSLRITGSPQLQRMPAFPALDLAQIPNSYLTDQENFTLYRPDVIELEDLGSLTSIRMPAGWASAAVVLIQNNASLTRVDFTGQSYIDYLSILNNPLLDTVGIGELDKVNVLEVVDNPRLSATTFDGVRRLDTTASGNAAAP